MKQKKSLIIFYLFFYGFFGFLSLITAYSNVWAKKYDYTVPYIKQLDYQDIGESACAPTSITMLLKYYFPNSRIDVPEVYHSGMQGYRYEGPASGYMNVGFAAGDMPGINGFSDSDKVDDEYEKYYFSRLSGWYSGLMSPSEAAEYLNSIWGGISYGGDATFNDVIDEIKQRPLILNINYNDNPKYGHYIVLRGYDDKDTDSILDDKFYVNDPYTKWAGRPNGNNREFDYHTISGWFKGRIIKFNPKLKSEERQYTVVVDNDNVQIEDKNNEVVWQEWYGPGNWFYPNESGYWAIWKPYLIKDGNYKIYINFKKDFSQTSVDYSLYSKLGTPLKNLTIDQKGAGWASTYFGCFYLENGAYLKVEDVPINCNIDSARFEYISSEQLTSYIDTALIIDSSGSMAWNDLSRNRLEAARYFIDRAEDQDYIAIIDFDERSYVDPLNGTIRMVKDSRNKLKAAVNGIDANGGTNIGEGLLAGYNQLFSGSENQQKIAVLLTDGQSDSNHKDLSVHYAEDFKNKGWQVYTIGLSDEADEDLLKYIADTTGGEYFKVSTNDAARNAIIEIYKTINREIHRAGETLLEESILIRQDEQIERTFSVARDILSLWIDRIIPGSDVEMSLIQPDGKLIGRSTNSDDVYHALGVTYEIYRVTNPMAGKWKVLLKGTDTAPKGEQTDLSVSVVPSDSDNSDGGGGSCFINSTIK